MSIRSRVIDYLTRNSRRPRPGPDDDFWYTHGTYQTSAGTDVNEDKALTYSAVWACVRVISEDLASLPLIVYRRDGKSKERAQDFPLYSLLHDAPNPEMSSMNYRECLQAHLLTWGNAYSEIQRDLGGRVIALWPLNPANMQVKRSVSNELIYEYQIQGGEKKIFPRRDILHLAGLGFNGLIGYSPIQYQREAIGVGLSEGQMQGNNTKNGARLSLAFTHPAPKAPSEEGRKAFRDAIRKEYGGSTGQQIAVLWEGMTVQPISMTMADAEFIDSRKYTRTEICGIFRVPPHKIGDLERATFSNIEESNIDYVVSTLRPWCVRWEQAINQQLLENSDEYFVEHLVDGLLRGNISSRYSAYATGRQWGWLSVNDARVLENMNPIGKGGDEYLKPMNMTAIGEPPPEPTSQNEFPIGGRKPNAS